jgi:hypothetical protein
MPLAVSHNIDIWVKVFFMCTTPSSMDERVCDLRQLIKIV